MNPEDDLQFKVQRDFSYDPATGILTRKFNSGDGQTKGRGGTGSIDNNGYVKFTWNGKVYHCHRLVWLYNYGVIPEERIDHIDRNPGNNRLDNLRLVSNSENLINSNRSNNPMRGIRTTGNKYSVRIKRNMKEIYLGVFNTLEEALVARREAENVR